MLYFSTGVSGQTTIHYTYDASGNRTERAINLGSLKSVAADTVFPRQQERIQDETFLPAAVLIYPNPTDGQLMVEITAPGDFESDFSLIVTNINGKQILKKNKESSRTLIDLSAQPAGVYIFYITRGSIVSRWKIVKM